MADQESEYERNRALRDQMVQAKMPDPVAMLGAILGPGYRSIIDRTRQSTPNLANFLDQAPRAMGVIGGRIPPSFNLSPRQMGNITAVENWLNQSNIPYNINMNRSNSSSVYIYARHPTTNEQVAIRVPRDRHIGYVDQRAVAKYKDTNRPGNFYDTGDVIRRTDTPVQPEYTGNVAGQPYADLSVLFDALSHRFSRSPSGQFLVPPGSQPHYPSERLTPIPLTQPPIAWGSRGIRQTPPESVLNPPRPPRRVVLPPRQLRLPGL